MAAVRSTCKIGKNIPLCGNNWRFGSPKEKTNSREEKKMSKKIYEMITNQIIERLEEGTIPWKMPWVNGQAINWKTEKPYRGMNKFLLDGGEYATFKQITGAGGSIKNGSEGHIVIFWKMLDIEDKETEERKRVPLLRYYKVFNIGEQTEGIEP